jgi:hypothetical protein
MKKCGIDNGVKSAFQTVIGAFEQARVGTMAQGRRV